MDHFIVSARKYRPDSFDTVVGQDSITKTLKNAINNNHLAHAYLFCGPRGVGKTTCARIFAKTINCFNINDQGEACNQCESCLSFNESRSFNIHELDAASNNTVDDIRSLIEQVRIPPQVGKYSIYIIDEVHMLSSSAFNAFLKTLEEPPAHAIFILATTEKHKIIPTILSRCQIYDFSRIQIKDSTNYLEKIAKNENISYEIDALNIIAQKADGGMRDALSIFDQIVSYCGNSITYKDVIENLNVLDYDYYFTLVDHFLNNNVSSTLLVFNEILNKGFDPRNFITGISSHFRDLLVCRDKETLQLLEVGENTKAKYLQQTSCCSLEFILSSLDILNKCDIGFSSSRNKRLHIELSLIMLCNIIAVKKNSNSDHIEEIFDLKILPNLNPTEVIQINQQVVKAAEKVHQESRIQTPNTVKETVAEGSAPTLSPKVTVVTQANRQLRTMQKNPGSSISIKDAFKKTEVIQKKENIENEVKPDTTQQELPSQIINCFSQEQLNEKWNCFAESVKQDQHRLYNTLISRTAVLKEESFVEFIVFNKLQLDIILEKKELIQQYLRRELSNNNLQLSIVLDERSEPTGLKLYTDEDKYTFLAKKNPILSKLRDELNLDFS